MSVNGSAVIKFLGYRVTDIVYKCSSEFEFPYGNSFSYKFNFTKSLNVLSDLEIQENVRVNVFFSENDDIENAPYRLSVEIAGRFESQEEWQEEWEMNALAILFPYLRSLVSNITSSSGREPIILPTLNVASLFEE